MNHNNTVRMEEPAAYVTATSDEDGIIARPVCIRPDLCVQITVTGLVLQVGQEQLFKVGALFTFRGGRSAVEIQ